MAQDGLTITYQGKVCLPEPFEFTRPVGLSPGSGFVHMHRDEFGTFDVEENVPGVDQAEAPSGGRTRSKRPRKKERKRGWLSAGTLVFREVVRGKVHEVVLDQILLAERSAVGCLALDDDNDVVRVELEDIRGLYKNRGRVSAWINVPRTGGGQPKAGKSAQRPGSVERLDPQFYVPGSLNSGKPWTLYLTLRRWILPNLPGAPTLRYMPLDLVNAIPVGHAWDGWLTRDALAELLEEFRLVFSLEDDGSVSLWKQGEGELERLNGAKVRYGLRDGTRTDEVDEDVAHGRVLFAHKQIPSSVLVLGPPKIETASLFLEPCMEVEGSVVALSEGLGKLGIPDDKARRLAILDTGHQPSVGIYGEALGVFRRCAFKWFQLPGGSKAHSDKLPLLEGRGITNDAGQLDPPVVKSEGHTFLKSAALLDAAKTLLANAAGKEAARLASKIGKLGELDNTAGVDLPFSVQSGGYTIDHARGIVMFASPQGLLEREGQPQTLSKIKTGQAQVQLEFGYQRKPALDDPLGIEHRYHAFFTRGADGSATRVDDVAENAAPLLVVRPDLQQMTGPQGETNVPSLDAVAKKIAEDAFAVPPTKVGAIVTFCRPAAVRSSGQVLSISWSTDQERPRTIAHIGAFAPLSPNPAGQQNLSAYRTREKPKTGGVP